MKKKSKLLVLGEQANAISWYDFLRAVERKIAPNVRANGRPHLELPSRQLYLKF